MEKALEKVVEDLAEKAVKTKSSLKAMHYTQSALNAINALIVLKQRERV